MGGENDGKLLFPIMLRGKKYTIQFYQNGTPNIRDGESKAMKPSHTEHKHCHFLAQFIYINNGTSLASESSLCC